MQKILLYDIVVLKDTQMSEHNVSWIKKDAQMPTII